MSNTKENTLELILDSIQNKLQRLLIQLDAEKKLLEQHALDDIEPLLKEKQIEFQQLNSDIALLQVFFSDSALEFSANSINPYILSASQSLQRKWQLFISTLRNCQEKNLFNGLLVMGMKNYNDKLLSLLTQQRPATYHPSPVQKKAVSTREHKA